MDRATCTESAIFSEGAEKFAASSKATGDPEIDLALSEGRFWLAEAKNLNLLSLYTSRFHRRHQKNMAELRRLQAERKAALEQAIEEAALLSHMAKTKGEAYNMAEGFPRRKFEFVRQESLADLLIGQKNCTQLCRRAGVFSRSAAADDRYRSEISR